MNLYQKANQILKFNLSKNEKLILLVDLLLNIPYKRVGLKPKDLVKNNCGSCTPKHIFLAYYIEKLEIPIKFLIIPFYYKNLNLNLPKFVYDVAQELPLCYHTALKIKINNTWIFIDVTWDNNLQNFPNNSNWDGKSNMILAVVPETIIEKQVKSKNFKKSNLIKFSKDEKFRKKIFYEQFDKFLINSRN